MSGHWNWRVQLVGRGLLALAAITLTAGCQTSPDKHYYLLEAPAASAWNKGDKITQLIGIGPIQLAEYLQRPQVVAQQTAGELDVDVNRIWAEPLDKGIVRVLTLHLTGSHAQRAAVSFPWRRDNVPALSLRVQILSVSRQSGQLSLSGNWELRAVPDQGSIAFRHFHYVQPAADGAQATALALSALLAALAADIAPALPAPPATPAKTQP